MHEQPQIPGEKSAASIRSLEVFVAAVLLLIAGVVIYDSMRIGVRWNPAIGPSSGMFPFMMGTGLAIASIMIILSTLRSSTMKHIPFVSLTGLRNILTVVIPFFVYVSLIGPLGLYVPAAIFIALFMIFIGSESVLKSITVGVAVPTVAFLFFEKWFLVPLPKGPLETALGLN